MMGGAGSQSLPALSMTTRSVLSADPSAASQRGRRSRRYPPGHDPRRCISTVRLLQLIKLQCCKFCSRLCRLLFDIS